MNRDAMIQRIRPTIPLDEIEYHSEIERFQNETLRPILKLQHNLTIELLSASQHFQKQKSKITSKSTYIECVKKYIQSDVGFKNTLIGIIVGMMTTEEYAMYISIKSECNKRIITMQVKRYADTEYTI